MDPLFDPEEMKNMIVGTRSKASGLVHAQGVQSLLVQWPDQAEYILLTGFPQRFLYIGDLGKHLLQLYSEISSFQYVLNVNCGVF